MKPILYQSVTEGTVPSDYGLGVLSDCLSCSVEEARNGENELVLEYPAQGLHAEDLQPLTIIKAKPNYTDDPQLFEVYKVSRVMNGRFTVNARHISYRLSNKVITSGTAASCAAACLLLQAQAGNFTITTDKATAGAFKITEPSSVRSWFGGKAGSLLDVYGPGEWKYDNFSASLLTARGMDRGVQIRYGKNLTQLSQEIDIENLATAIIPYYIDDDGNVTTGAAISTGLVIDDPREFAVDFSADVDPESSTPIATQLATLGAAYVSNNNFTNAINSITLDFVQLAGLTERVDLCDTVSIYFEALGISASLKCVKTVWDVLEERYTACTFGALRVNIADTIATQEKQLEKTATRSQMAESIKHATDLISGNLGGYVVIHDSNGDGEPDEILIMDTPDITTAVKVWRWNSGGLGYSSTGYAGPYGTAITQNGEIVANYITSGILNANIIKAGILEDAAQNSSIDLTNGAALLYQLTAKDFVDLIDTSNVRRALLYVDPYDHGNLTLFDENGQPRTGIYGDSSIVLWNADNTASISIQGATSAIECKRIKPYDLTVSTDYGMTGSGALSVVAAEWVIKRMGNIVFMSIPFKGNGTAIANGANAFSGHLTLGAMPQLEARLVGYYGGSCFVMRLEEDGTITIRNCGGSQTISASGRLILAGYFLVDD